MEKRATLIKDGGQGGAQFQVERFLCPPLASLSAMTSSFQCGAVYAEFLPVLSLLRHPTRASLPAGRPAVDASYALVPFIRRRNLAREALLVTFDEQVDPQLVRAALEDLLRKGALRWVGLKGSNVQVWRTADIARALKSQRSGAK